jgi:hypothetical protein
MIVAWHEVPGKSAYRENRPVGYGMIGRSYPRGVSRRGCAPCSLRRAIYFAAEISSLQIEIGAHACANQTVPYGTALLGGAIPGTSCQATIASSLRDKSRSPIEGPPTKSALIGLKSWAESSCPFRTKNHPNSPHLRPIPDGPFLSFKKMSITARS